MKHLLLSALLLAGLAGCKNSSSNDPTPATTNSVTLLAKWQVDSTWTQLPGGPKTKLATYPSPKLYWEFTGTQIISYVLGSANLITPYTQVGSVITLSTGSSPTNVLTIQKLTEHRLVLTNVPDGYPAGTTVRSYTTSSR